MMRIGETGNHQEVHPPKPEPCWVGPGRRFVAAVVLVFVLAGKHLAILTQPDTNLAMLWGRSDVVFLLASLVAVAFLLTLAGELVRRLPWPGLVRLTNHLFVLALGAGLLSNLSFYARRPSGYHIGQFGVEMSTLWLLMFAVVGYAFGQKKSKLVLRSRQFCQILAPAVVIVAGVLLTPPGYPIHKDTFPTGSAENVTVQPVDFAEARSCPIYLLSFDEWSFRRSFQNGELNPNLSHLRAFSKQSLVFLDAHAQGEETVVSLPALLFQTDWPARVERGLVGFERDGAFVRSTDLESLFAVGKVRGYRCGMVAFGQPYNLWLGDQVDYCRSYPWHYRGHDALGALAYHAQEIASAWTDPWSRFVRDRWQTRVPDAHFLRTYREMTADILEVIEHQPTKTFLIAHYPVPHHPYILDKEGQYLGPNFEQWDKADTKGYFRNIQVMDHLLGEFVEAMKGAGRFDDALVILTSDHSWRNDPEVIDDPNDDLTHVPLLVKLPGQTVGVAVKSRFSHLQIADLIQNALESDGDPVQLAKELKLDLREPSAASLAQYHAPQTGGSRR